MDIRKCARCGRFFQTIRSRHCGDCQDAIDREWRQISNYLLAHPDATAAGIAAALEIDERTIVHLLNEGRLELKQEPAAFCQRCGQPIRSGRFCRDCVARMAQDLKKSVADSAADRSGGGVSGWASGRASGMYVKDAAPDKKK